MAVADLYSRFAELAAKEKRGIDFAVYSKDRNTPIVVIAPHGGFIEPGTSQIAKAIAGDALSIYSFEGLIKGRPHGDLHITSHLFDEPEALRLVGSAETAIAIHGRGDHGDPATVLLGGRNIALRDAIASSLKDASFQVGLADRGMDARDPGNICNRGRSRRGVQLELPLTLRDRLTLNEDGMRMFSVAVRRGLTGW